MTQEKEDRITRERLRALKDGESITVACSDYNDQQSQANTAYFMQKLQGCKFSCRTDGLNLTVTRLPESAEQ